MNKPTEQLKDRLRKALDIRKFTQQDLADKTGIPKASISQYLSGLVKPKDDRVYSISVALSINEAWLLGFDVPMDRSLAYSSVVEEHTAPSAAAKPSAAFTDDEIERIQKYRFISRHSPAGAETVDYILNREYDVAKQQESVPAQENVRYVSFYNKLASAGTGQILFDDIPMELIAIPDISQYKRVNYALAVNGGSMEPEFYDGDIILIESTHEIRKGEIGIFVVDNEAYIKELGDQILISLNQEYDNIPLTEYSRCLGRVVGKLEKL